MGLISPVASPGLGSIYAPSACWFHQLVLEGVPEPRAEPGHPLSPCWMNLSWGSCSEPSRRLVFQVQNADGVLPSPSGLDAPAGHTQAPSQPNTHHLLLSVGRIQRQCFFLQEATLIPRLGALRPHVSFQHTQRAGSPVPVLQVRTPSRKWISQAQHLPASHTCPAE